MYTFAWNEERVLPFFLRHYFDWFGVERIHVYDNESTDSTAAICDADPRIRRYVYNTEGKHTEVDAMVGIRNVCWHEARGQADLVIVVDCDELLHHNDLPGFLTHVWHSKVAVVQATGYEMACLDFPPEGVHLPNHVRLGVQSPTYSKPCLLVPHRVERIRFAPGAHTAQVKADGCVGMISAALRLLHYPRLGWPYYLERMMSRRSRVGGRDAEQGLAQHYTRAESAMREEFDHVIRNAVDCVT